VIVAEVAMVRGSARRELVPELWLLRGHSVHLERPHSLRSDEYMTVASWAETEEEA
jgi:hypothetical protein